jgi:O-antigen/teichoic acid export membrane protein
MQAAVNDIFSRILKQRTALASLVAMGIKGGGALMMIAVFTLAARAMAADEFGRLAVWFNAMAFLAVFATFGQETLIARSWGEFNGAGDPGLAWGAYAFGWRLTMISGAVVAAGLVIFAPFVNQSVAPITLYAIASCLFTQTLLHYSSHSTRVMVGFVVSEVNRELTWRLVLLIVIIWSVLHQGLTLTEFFCASTAGMTLSLFFQLAKVWRKHLEARDAGIRIREPEPAARAAWFTRARAMWISAIVESVSAYSDVMLIGYFVSPAVAGDYFVAARIANAFLMVNAGLNTYSMAQSAKLHFSGENKKLQDILRSIVSVSAAVCFPALLIVLLFGSQLLTIFGVRFAGVYPTLAVLSAGSFVVAMCGGAPGILLTTGHEQLYSRVVLVATAVRMALTVILATHFGTVGAAVGWTVVNAPLAIFLSVVCRSICGVDTSLANLLRRAPADPAQDDGHPSLAGPPA